MMRRTLVWPWHGRLQGGAIILSDGSTRSHPQPAGSDYFERCQTFLFRNPAATPITTAEQLQAPPGGVFRNHALLQAGWLYGKNLAGWIWLDSEGTRWMVRPLYLSVLGSLTVFQMRLRFTRFGNFGGEPAYFERDVLLTLSGMPTNSQLNALAGAEPVFDRKVTSISETGRVAVITLGVRPEFPTAQATNCLKPYAFLVVQLTGAGTDVEIGLTQPYSYSQFTTTESEVSSTGLWLGRYDYTEVSRVPSGDNEVTVTYDVTRITSPTKPGFGENPLDAPSEVEFLTSGTSSGSGTRLVDLVLVGETPTPLRVRVEVSAAGSGGFVLGTAQQRIERRRASDNQFLGVVQEGAAASTYTGSASGSATISLEGAVSGLAYQFTMSNSMSWEESQDALHAVGAFGPISWDQDVVVYSALNAVQILVGGAIEAGAFEARMFFAAMTTALYRPHSSALLMYRRTQEDEFLEGRSVTPDGVEPTGLLPTSQIIAGGYYGAYNPSTQQLAFDTTPLTWI